MNASLVYDTHVMHFLHWFLLLKWRQHSFLFNAAANTLIKSNERGVSHKYVKEFCSEEFAEKRHGTHFTGLILLQSI